MHTCIHAVHAYMHACMHLLFYRMHACMHACVHACITVMHADGPAHTHTYACMHTSHALQVDMHTHMHTCMHTHVRRIHRHTHTHAHIHVFQYITYMNVCTACVTCMHTCVHRTTPHHITSQFVTSHLYIHARIASRHITSHCIKYTHASHACTFGMHFSYPIAMHHATSRHVTPRHILRCMHALHHMHEHACVSHISCTHARTQHTHTRTGTRHTIVFHRSPRHAIKDIYACICACMHACRHGLIIRIFARVHVLHHITFGFITSHYVILRSALHTRMQAYTYMHACMYPWRICTHRAYTHARIHADTLAYFSRMRGYMVCTTHRHTYA